MITVGVALGGVCDGPCGLGDDWCPDWELDGRRPGSGPPMISGLTPFMRAFAPPHTIRCWFWMSPGNWPSFLTLNNMAASRIGCRSWIDGWTSWPTGLIGVTVVTDCRWCVGEALLEFCVTIVWMGDRSRFIRICWCCIWMGYWIWVMPLWECCWLCCCCCCCTICCWLCCWFFCCCECWCCWYKLMLLPRRRVREAFRLGGLCNFPT